MTTITDERLERNLANLLRYAVMLSASVVATGGACYLIQHGADPVAYGQFHAAPYRTVPAIVAGLRKGDCHAIIQFGLLLLIATPVARVAASFIAFAVQRDSMYAAISLIVLLILMYSLIAMH